MTTELLPILYQDDDLIAVNKPAGLLVHRSEIDRRETRFAMQMVRDQIGAHVFTLHRLDRGTSGILLFAKSAEMAALMMPLFQTRAISKSYLAVVRGIAPASLLLDYPLSRLDDKPGRKARSAEREEDDEASVQSAQTQLQRLAHIELPICVDKYPVARYSLVRAEPISGRRHQIRRHLKHLAHPIIGDVRYGKGTHNRFFREQFGAERMLLASVALQFHHPRTQQLLTIHCAPDGAMGRLHALFGWDGLQ